MTAEATLPRRGRKPRFSQEQLVDAALEIVDAEGFDALSLSGVARQLGVTPMAMYTYVQGSDELGLLVIERLVANKVRAISWPEAWQDALRVFAVGLGELLDEHPAMTEAYGEGVVSSERALEVAELLLTRLLDGGLTEREAADAYAAVHAVVIGSVVLRRRRSQPVSSRRLDPLQFPSIVATAAVVERLADAEAARLVDLLISGVEARMAPPV